MPRGVIICPSLRQIIWRQIITYGKSADSVYLEIFDGDDANISLKTLKNLHCMFIDPLRQDETAIYLYADRIRGTALCDDHSCFDFIVAEIIARYPQQSVPFYVSNIVIII